MSGEAGSGSSVITSSHAWLILKIETISSSEGGRWNFD